MAFQFIRLVALIKGTSIERRSQDWTLGHPNIKRLENKKEKPAKEMDKQWTENRKQAERRAGCQVYRAHGEGGSEEL